VSRLPNKRGKCKGSRSSNKRPDRKLSIANPWISISQDFEGLIVRQYYQANPYRSRYAAARASNRLRISIPL
jgi:hypothetical protein